MAPQGKVVGVDYAGGRRRLHRHSDLGRVVKGLDVRSGQKPDQTTARIGLASFSGALRSGTVRIRHPEVGQHVPMRVCGCWRLADQMRASAAREEAEHECTQTHRRIDESPHPARRVLVAKSVEKGILKDDEKEESYQRP